MEWLTEPELSRCLREHFVSISGKCIQVDGSCQQVGKEQNFAFSAFVIEICGVWCLVTAGHVLKNIEESVRHPRMRLVRCGLADFFSLSAKVKDPTPFAYEDAHKIYIDQDGMDIGLIPLRDFYKESVKANGIVPLPVARWEGHVPPAYEG